MASANLNIAERFTNAVYGGDTETIRSLLDENFVLRQDRALPYGGVYEGADGFLSFLNAFGAGVEIESLENTRTFVCSDDADVLVFEFAFRGKLRSSGLPFTRTVLERWEFQNRKIISITPHWFEIPGSASS